MVYIYCMSNGDNYYFSDDKKCFILINKAEPINNKRKIAYMKEGQVYLPSAGNNYLCPK